MGKKALQYNSISSIEDVQFFTDSNEKKVEKKEKLTKKLTLITAMIPKGSASKGKRPSVLNVP